MVLKKIFFIVFVVVVAKGFDVQLPQEQQRPQQQPQHQPQQQPQQQPHQQEEQQADALEQVVVVGVEPDAQAQNGGAAEQVEVILQNSRRHRLINKKMFFLSLCEALWTSTSRTGRRGRGAGRRTDPGGGTLLSI